MNFQLCMIAPDETPLLTALAIAARRPQTPFYAPGHKRGQGAFLPLQDLLGTSVFKADLPELPELDNLFAPAGPILEAQQLAAQAFGAEETFFLANGSTGGIEAAILAVCAPGDKILVPRNAHRSVLAALVLSGAQPVYLSPKQERPWDLALGVTADQVDQALKAEPDIRAVVVVSPSYQGVCANIAAIAHRVHQHGCTLIVDEAHGAHLSFHEQLPQGAIAGGADIVIQSTHKVLSALTQASMLHVQGHQVDRDRLRQALQLTQSTSPNYLLLASLDAARQQMATQGHPLLEGTLNMVGEVRSQLAQLQPLKLLSPDDMAGMRSDFQLDLTRLVVDVSSLGITGFTADEFLHEQMGVTAELPTVRQLTFIFSVGNTATDGDRLVQAFQTLIQQSSTLEATSHLLLKTELPQGPLISTPPVTPREAFFAKSQTVGISASVGHLCADTVCPYPPGIPALLPGEVITAAAIAQLQQIKSAGGVITGSADPDFHTLRIIC